MEWGQGSLFSNHNYYLFICSSFSDHYKAMLLFFIVIFFAVPFCGHQSCSVLV